MDEQTDKWTNRKMRDRQRDEKTDKWRTDTERHA